MFPENKKCETTTLVIEDGVQKSYGDDKAILVSTTVINVEVGNMNQWWFNLKVTSILPIFL